MKINIEIKDKDQANALIEELKNLEFGVKNWKELKSVSGYYISGCNICPLDCGSTRNDNQNVFPTKALAVSALAASQLSQLMVKANGDWIPTWDNRSEIFTIYRLGNKAIRGSTHRNFEYLHFKTREIRDDFFAAHIDLINQYLMVCA